MNPNLLQLISIHIIVILPTVLCLPRYYTALDRDLTSGSILFSIQDVLYYKTSENMIFLYISRFNNLQVEAVRGDLFYYGFYINLRSFFSNTPSLKISLKF